ncbi:hypothetical protein JTE90_026339 [Oedothorax gibbosus]|uniref:Translation initiation factor eIF2B subunit delta n=1 Tax=Oedothorax gibbosus TaxID=931172 RepID=A0AAV6U5K4_9ARAC|nr:hypothetical protein JTE90_026339 [Oedothorax gibbosus]
MSDPQGQKKKNKKKKKPSPAANPAQPPPPTSGLLAEITQNGAKKDAFNITEVLPQKVGMKTVFNDVEVTLTHSGAAATSEVVNGTSKKKKKKKKSKQASVAPSPEATVTDNQNDIIKFNEDRIELLNHPEISVTISKSTEVPKPVSIKLPAEATPASESKEEVVAAASANSKKKKNKKKKKKNSENSVPAEPTPEVADSADPSYTAPTYVKLPASGDSCVLLVSHESFSNENKTAATNSESSQNSSKTVLVQSKERIEELKALSALNSKSQNQASVSILPVTSDSNKMPEKSGSISMDSSLQKVSDLLKKESEGGDSAACSSVQEPGSISEGATLSKAQLKAERRAKQEAQRAAKLDKSAENKPPETQPKIQPKPTAEPESVSATKPNGVDNSVTTVHKAALKPSVERESPRSIFSHLPQCKDTSIFSGNLSNIHPAILEIGAYYKNGVVFGSNARCLGFLAAFRDAIKDHKTPPNKEFAKDLESKLQTYLKFLNNCRPLSVSILNSVRFLKHQINHIPKDLPEEKVKEDLCLAINNFVKEEILLAKEAICISASAKIVDGDTIIVFAYSSLVKDVLCKAHDQNKSFQVVVVESRSKMEGNETMRRLLGHGLRCCYVSASAASFMMKTASKVIIGAHALLANGSVMSRVGSMKLVEMAQSCGVPVLVCCETYKFCERALTDSFVHNELGSPEDLAHISCNKNDSLQSWSSLKKLQIHNILYDVTPSDLISVVITEKGLLPCTSVPVVLRVKQAGLHE